MQLIILLRGSILKSYLKILTQRLSMIGSNLSFNQSRHLITFLCCSMEWGIIERIKWIIMRHFLYKCVFRIYEQYVIYIYINKCVNIYTHLYVYIYTHIYVHTHIHKYPEFFFLRAFTGIYLYISLEEDSEQDSQSGWQLSSLTIQPKLNFSVEVESTGFVCGVLGGFNNIIHFENIY